MITTILSTSNTLYGKDMDTMGIDEQQVAVLIPCYNEEGAIKQVIESFRQELPSSTIYVYDNNSTDNTVEVAKSAGAVVNNVPIQGKGAVVRQMFADIEADVYVLVDGDDTYDAPSINPMIQRFNDKQLDMLVGTRLSAEGDELFRPGHRFGNQLFTGVVALLFGQAFKDILSGYRVFSRRFVKTFPAMSDGFQVETELTVHTLEMKLPCGDFETPYYERAEGTESKLSTFKDGFKILKTILYLLKEHKPFIFFGMISAFLCVLSLVLSWPLLQTFMETGLVPRIPTAILSTGIMILSFLSLSIGIILDSVKQGKWEIKRMRYLAYKR